MLRAAQRNFASHVVGKNGQKYTVNTKLLIDGKFVDSVSGKTFETQDPATGKTIALVAAAQKEDVDLAVKAAKKAFYDSEWSTMSNMQRTELIFEFGNQVAKHADELQALEMNDNGKNPDAAMFDV
jgi:acyl-CoA reductase-like NAD-dependent aldehyde dehydrogenase